MTVPAKIEQFPEKKQLVCKIKPLKISHGKMPTTDTIVLQIRYNWKKSMNNRLIFNMFMPQTQQYQ